MGIVYLVILCFGTSFPHAPLMLSMALLTAVGFAGFGYFLNDMTDVAVDRAVGKPNSAAAYGPRSRAGLLAALAALALLPWLVLPLDTLGILLVFLQFAAFTAYSVPPLRLKESPVFSVLADALYAHALPVVLAFHTFSLITGRREGYALLGFLFLWQLCGGIRYFLNHLALDRPSDIHNGIPTLAVHRGNGRLYRWISCGVMPAEILFFILCRASIPVEGRWLFLAAALGLLLLDYILLPLVSGVGPGPYFLYSFKKVPADHYYQRVFPLLCLCLLVSVNPWFAVLLVLHLLFFYSPVSGNFVRKLGQRARVVLSFVVNHAIYYFRKYILFYGEKKARGADYDTYVIQREKLKGIETNGSVAVVNVNLEKYTETFVKGHVQHLPGNTCFYYGGDFPLFERQEGALLDMTVQKRAWRRFLSEGLGLPPGYYEKKAFIGSLKKNNVRILLAEFGTVGAGLAEVSVETGIPMVVIFYGYDAYRKDVLEAHSESYRLLFRTAVRIVAVSLHMKAQLEHLGAPPEKTVYLPCYVDLERFAYTDHSGNAPVFLAVGRFAETKSPHLTILAFHRVWQEFPEARLVMVGKDGGGELFEACHILVKALKIEECVAFRGILSPAEVYEEMRQAYAFVQHSVTTPIYGDSEGTPVAVLESLAGGLPVVATRHAGIAEFVTDGENGYLVDEYDMEGMAKKMADLLRDREKARRFGIESAKRIRENPLVTAHMQELWNILEQGME